MSNIEKEICIENDLTVYKVFGPFTVQEIGDELERYYSEHLTKLTLWDFVRGDHRLVTSDHILELVQKMKERSYLRQDGKTAIVTHKDADFGMTRMLQAYAESQKIEFEIEVFKDIEKAKEWLGVLSLQIND